VGLFKEGEPFGIVVAANEGGTRVEPATEEVPLMAAATKLDVGGEG
jgi:hypothetical protein